MWGFFFSPSSLKALLITSFVVIYYLYRTLQQERRQYEKSLSSLSLLRDDERKGRTTAERQLRDLQNKFSVVDSTSDKYSNFPTVHWQAIGILRSCYDQRNGTPRNSGVVPDSVAILKLRPDLQRACLERLELFSHVWLISVFHQNTNLKDGVTLKAKVSPPRLGGEKVGLFSTRTPHRPNAVSLSVAKIDKIIGSTMYLSGIDMIDGTPIIDIKPYIPSYDALRDAKVPQWIITPHVPPPNWYLTQTKPARAVDLHFHKILQTLCLVFRKIEIDEITRAELKKYLSQSKLYKNDEPRFFSFLTQVLSLDMRFV